MSMRDKVMMVMRGLRLGADPTRMLPRDPVYVVTEGAPSVCQGDWNVVGDVLQWTFDNEGERVLDELRREQKGREEKRLEEGREEKRLQKLAAHSSTELCR